METAEKITAYVDNLVGTPLFRSLEITTPTRPSTAPRGGVRDTDWSALASRCRASTAAWGPQRRCTTVPRAGSRAAHTPPCAGRPPRLRATTFWTAMASPTCAGARGATRASTRRPCRSFGGAVAGPSAPCRCGGAFSPSKRKTVPSAGSRRSPRSSSAWRPRQFARMAGGEKASAACRRSPLAFFIYTTSRCVGTATVVRVPSCLFSVSPSGMPRATRFFWSRRPRRPRRPPSRPPLFFSLPFYFFIFFYF